MVRSVAVSLLLFVVLLFPGEAYCGSPYSAGGLGFIIPDETGFSQAIGGAGTAVGNGVNMMRGNPALLGTFKIPTYSLATHYDNIQTDIDNPDKPVYAKLNLSLIKFVLPLGKGIVMGWGLSPYSRTDVTINISSNPGDIFQDKMKSSGGINVSTFGLSSSIRNRVFFGASVNYYFGVIAENWTRTFPDNPEMHGKTDYLNRKFSGYSASAGILVNPFKRVFLGAGYTTKADVDMNIVLHAGSSLDPEVPVTTRKVNLPSTLRLGISSRFTDRVIAAFDYTVEWWEDAAVTPRDKLMYSDSMRYGGGLRFTPSARINAPFYLKLPISAGFKAGTLYYNSYPLIESVKEKSLTLGIEIPFGGGTGRLYNSFEYGIRGDKSKNGWEETFFRYGLSFIGIIK